jgi:hypothetical protein
MPLDYGWHNILWRQEVVLPGILWRRVWQPILATGCYYYYVIKILRDLGLLSYVRRSYAWRQSVVLSSSAGDSESRFAAYVEALGGALGHADRIAPARRYCAGLLLPGERKSIEPMAARVEPGRVQAAHQSLHHLVAKADWSDTAMLAVVRSRVLSAIEQHGSIQAWIIDDTGFPKKGTHSVGVARQYCGQLGKQDNSLMFVVNPYRRDGAASAGHAKLKSVWLLRSAGGRATETTVSRL